MRQKYAAENYRLAAEPDQRRDFFNDKDIATLSPENYRQQVSYCAQTPALFGDSVYDNWSSHGRSATNSRILKRWLPISNASGWRIIRWRNPLMSFPAVKNSGSRSFVICSFYRRFCCLMKLPARWMKVISATLTRLFIATRRKKGGHSVGHSRSERNCPR